MKFILLTIIVILLFNIKCTKNNLSSSENEIGSLKRLIEESNRNFKQPPASYKQSTINNNIFKVNLKVVREEVTNPESSNITPPLKGFPYFCVTSDNFGYYVFTKEACLKKTMNLLDGFVV